MNETAAPAARLEKTLLSKPPHPGALRTSLLGLSLLMLVFSLDQQGLFGLPESISASRAQVFGQGEAWRAFSSALLHADLKHFLANSFFFTGLAYLLNAYFGAWIFPVLGLLSGGLVNWVVLYFYPEQVTVVGISGAVYFMAAFWLTMYCLIQRGLSPWRRLTNALALSLVLLFPTLIEERVSYLAHAVGYALGIPLAALYFVLNKHSIRSHEVWRGRGEGDEGDDDGAYLGEEGTLTAFPESSRIAR